MNFNPDTKHDHLLPSYTDTQIHDILVLIGFLTVCVILFILIIQFFIKVRELYRQSEPKISYGKLVNKTNQQCRCLPTFQCIKPTYQISDSSPYYEQVNNSVYRIINSRTSSSCIRVHII
ncbi:hypothetical protein I4U23_029818 [Adineta vaga]|nr:hypothetical protein I4U23_029818 [Adineta vaga]